MHSKECAIRGGDRSRSQTDRKCGRDYEVLMAPVEGAPLTIAEPVTLPSAKVEAALPQVAPGTLVTLCARAVGAKGAGPFYDSLVARVN